MKRSKFTEAQMAYILRQAEEGTSVEEVCRRAGISIQTLYRWRKRGGHLISKMRYLSAQLEAYLQGDLWLADARHANAQAARHCAGG